MTQTQTATDYNGWTNYETWNVALHIDNERGSQEYWRERAECCLKTFTKNPEKGSVLTVVEQAAMELSNELKDSHEENAPELEGTYGDLLNAALSSVNWYEIAKNMVEELEGA